MTERWPAQSNRPEPAAVFAQLKRGPDAVPLSIKKVPAVSFGERAGSFLLSLMQNIPEAQNPKRRRLFSWSFLLLTRGGITTNEV